VGIVAVGILLVIIAAAIMIILSNKMRQLASERPKQGTLPKDEQVQTKSPREPLVVVGRLKHKRVHLTASIKDTYNHYWATCPVCLANNQSVFSDAVDSAGNEIRCCLPCLLKYGGKQELEAAAKRSKYARRVATCMAAFSQLCEEFPNPDRRPHGGPTLLGEISDPVVGLRTGTDRIINKIKKRKWTEYDLARIEGRPEPSGDLQARLPID
jgi:hypothetical protein